MLKKEVLILVAIVAAVLAILLWAEKSASAGRPHFQHSNLTITHADGTSFSFAIEVATSPYEQEYGLMFVRSLDEDAGMIFPYNPPREVAFWMKNTLIPLDMLFVSPDGTIGRIVSQARPEDLTPISSQGAVIGVIELKGGIAKKDGFAVGDKVSSPVLTP
jgi:uncharacterized membrane protein (UPF0127 family)